MANKKPLVITSGEPRQIQSGDTLVDGDSVSFAQFNKNIDLIGIITPPLITAATVNDYAPTGFSTAAILRLSADTGGTIITGLAGGLTGKIIIIYNVGSNIIQLTNDDGATSTAANRFVFIGSGTDANVYINPNGLIILQYDITSARWHSTATSLTSVIPTSFGRGLLQGAPPDEFSLLTVHPDSTLSYYTANVAALGLLGSAPPLATNLEISARLNLAILN